MSFLAAKLGFLPVWGWAAAGLGGYGGWRYYQNSSSRMRGRGPNNPGGQNIGEMDNVNAESAWIENQNLGWDTIPDSWVQPNPGLSFIDGSFFGEGPLSLWTAGPMEYSDVFGGSGGPGGRRRKDRRRGRGVFGTQGGGRDLFDSPPGAGGFGYHHSKGPRFPPSPVGGEGFDNAGQNVVGFGGGRSMGGGMPFPMQSQQGALGNQYMIQDGDTLTGIATKLWGRGSDYSGLIGANATLSNRGANDSLPTGLSITIPGAPSAGPPAPGGPAGNGVGGGSIGAQGFNTGGGPAPYDQANGTAGAYSAASGGGSPSAGQSGSNSSRVKAGHASSNYAMGGGQSGVQTSNRVKSTKSAPPPRNRPTNNRRGK